MTDIRAEEYWAKKGDVDLFVFRKRQAGATGHPVLFLVHGSSFCGPTGFDLQVPGRDDYSLMERFARAGFDVWTMDHEGYGRSSRTDGNSDIASGVEDLKAGFAIVERETGAASALPSTPSRPEPGSVGSGVSAAGGGSADGLSNASC